jgi:hypothetical protein
MKQALFIPVLCFFAFMAPTFPVLARPGGCVKGAIVGGIVGHFVGHGGVGAAAGCAYGVHRRNSYDRENNADEGRSGYAQPGGHRGHASESGN